MYLSLGLMAYGRGAHPGAPARRRVAPRHRDHSSAFTFGLRNCCCSWPPSSWRASSGAAPRSRSLRGLRRLAFMALQAVLLLAALSLSQQLAKHAPVFNLTQLAKNNAGQASSLHYHQGPVGLSPGRLHRGVRPTALQCPRVHPADGRLREHRHHHPHPHGDPAYLALRAAPRSRGPTCSCACCTRWPSPTPLPRSTTWGSSTASRVLFLPFLLVLLAIPVSPKGVPKQFTRGSTAWPSASDDNGPSAGACPPRPVADGPRSRRALTPGHAARQGAASCHAWSMSTSHSSYCRSARPVRCSCHSGPYRGGLEQPAVGQPTGVEELLGPRPQRARAASRRGGCRSPSWAAPPGRRGRNGAGAAAAATCPVPSRTFSSRGRRHARAATAGSRNGTRPFEAGRHGGPVDLGEDVVGQVRHGVEVHHELDGVVEGRPRAPACRTAVGGSLRTEDQPPPDRRSARPGSRRSRAGRAAGSTRGHLLHLGAGHAHAPPTAGSDPPAAAKAPVPPRRRAPPRAVPPRRAAAGRGTGRTRRQNRSRPSVAVVAAEELVASVARQRHGDVRARQAGEHRGGDLRRVGEGLVVDLRQAGDRRRSASAAVTHSSWCSVPRWVATARASAASS